MPFFEFMKRMIEGRPVFDDQPDAPVSPSSLPAPDASAPQQPAIRKNDDRSFPVVKIKRVSSRQNGVKLQIYGWIANEWPQKVMLDKVRLFDTTRELDSFLNGHEERELLLYDGPAPVREAHEAQLDYRTERERDYFRAILDVHCAYHADTKTYSVSELQLRMPIRDIYE